MNFLNKLCISYLEILSKCYKGAYDEALYKLKKNLSYSNWKNYIFENYKQMIPDSAIKEFGTEFYRIRDDDNELVNDCNHVPYSQRFLASNNRFNMTGFPCLYIADSQETAEKECGTLNKKYRFLGKFKLIDCTTSYSLMNLVIPEDSEIDNASSSKLFTWIITYPLLMLCLCKVPQDKIGQKFNEEYLFPQLLFHYLFMQKSEYNIIGIAHTSTKDRNGISYVIPAKYNDDNPPKSGHSEMLKSIFEEIKPPKLIGIKS